MQIMSMDVLACKEDPERREFALENTGGQKRNARKENRIVARVRHHTPIVLLCRNTVGSGRHSKSKIACHVYFRTRLLVLNVLLLSESRALIVFAHLCND